MFRTRRDIWKFGGGWSETTLWYARAVGRLSRSSQVGCNGWLRLAEEYAAGARAFQTAAPAAHPRGGRSRPRKLPRPSGFLSWHRARVDAFEAAVAREIEELGGPPDWALPYWNYSDPLDPNARDLPPVFESEHLPDGSPNPLRVAGRHGAGGGLVVLTPNDVGLRALLEEEFAGWGDGGAPGFGGSASGPSAGFLEQAPHDVVHGRIGGRDGLMSCPETAAVDPIFWVHHANIDRLWQVWLNRKACRGDEAVAGVPRVAEAREDPKGPPSEPKREAAAALPGYVYEDLSDPFDGVTRRAARASALAPSLRPPRWAKTTSDQRPTKPAELLASHERELPLEGGVARVSVGLDHHRLAALASSYTRPTREPDRIFLALEGIRGANDAAIFEVYLDLPSNAVPGECHDRLVGVVSLFGVRGMLQRARDLGGRGPNKILDATPVFDRLRAAGALARETLAMDFVPTSDIRPADRIRIRRVSLWRQASR